MSGGGKVTIEATNVFADESYCRANPELAPGQYVLVCVSDMGHGMPPDVLNRAFEPFFTTKEPGQGTGLGLSQVYGFVKQSGGHVKIYSEVDQGTTVKIYLPRYSRWIEEQEQEQAAVLGQAQAGETILIVEDDSELCSMHAHTRGKRALLAHPFKGEPPLQLLELDNQARRTADDGLLGLAGCVLATQVRQLQGQHVAKPADPKGAMVDVGQQVAAVRDAAPGHRLIEANARPFGPLVT